MYCQHLNKALRVTQEATSALQLAPGANANLFQVFCFGRTAEVLSTIHLLIHFVNAFLRIFANRYSLYFQSDFSNALCRCAQYFACFIWLMIGWYFQINFSKNALFQEREFFNNGA